MLGHGSIQNTNDISKIHKVQSGTLNNAYIEEYIRMSKKNISIEIKIYVTKYNMSQTRISTKIFHNSTMYKNSANARYDRYDTYDATLSL